LYQSHTYRRTVSAFSGIRGDGIGAFLFLERQPALNLQIAKAYLAGKDNGIASRTWQNALESLIASKEGEPKAMASGGQRQGACAAAVQSHH
jgi:hypothetical protein